MAIFSIALNNTEHAEGGYGNGEADSGNWYGGVLIGTNRGISAPLLASYLGRIPTVAEMQNLSSDDAAAIYEKNFWMPMRGNEINSQDEANSIFDSCVNMGCEKAIVLAQQSLGVPQTGHMDDTTLNGLNN